MSDDYKPLTTLEKIGVVTLLISSVVVMFFCFLELKTLTDWILK